MATWDQGEWASSIESGLPRRDRRSGTYRRRSDSATALIVRDLPATPVLTSATAERIHHVSHVATDRALAELVAAHILDSHERRGVRSYQARDVLDLVTATERRLASTKFDARASWPIRPVPARPDRRI